MDDDRHRENGRNKPDMYKTAQSQWLMQHQPSMKQIMSIMAERDAAIQERNMALNEKNKALEERDLTIMQRDAAIQERNEALMERDNALAALQFQQNSLNGENTTCPPGCQMSCGVKYMLHDGEASYDAREVPVADGVSLSSAPSESAKPWKVKRAKGPKTMPNNKKARKPSRKVKREDDDLNKTIIGEPREWKGGQENGGEDFKQLSALKPDWKVQDLGTIIGEPREWKGGQENGGEDFKQLSVLKPDWKVRDLGLNRAVFDELSMPPPVCSCTGVYRQCYKWGNGGWQSACCTTTVSMYPLPTVPNKRHARVGGRKMSGSAFYKLINRLAAGGHDLSTPLDLKGHWAKHGTNRYITIR